MSFCLGWVCLLKSACSGPWFEDVCFRVVGLLVEILRKQSFEVWKLSSWSCCQKSIGSVILVRLYSILRPRIELVKLKFLHLECGLWRSEGCREYEMCLAKEALCICRSSFKGFVGLFSFLRLDCSCWRRENTDSKGQTHMPDKVRTNIDLLREYCSC